MKDICYKLFVALLIFGVVAICGILGANILHTQDMALTPTPTVWSYLSEDDLRRIVEADLREYIRLWEQDLDLYNITKDSGDPKIEEIHLRTKARMNDLAESYNTYLQRYSYLFGGTLPEGIYAAIEPIGD